MIKLEMAAKAADLISAITVVLIIIQAAVAMPITTTSPPNHTSSMIQSGSDYSNETCYRITTFDYRQFKLSSTGHVLVDDSQNSNSYDFVMRPLDPYDHSAMLSIEQGIVFLWRIISPGFITATGQTSRQYYLSANSCGDNLQAKSKRAEDKIERDGHFTRHRAAEDLTFRYQLYNMTDCYVHIHNSGRVQAMQYNDTPPSTLLHTFQIPVYNSFTDLKLQTAACY